MTARPRLLVALGLATGCTPVLDARLSPIEETRILAVIAEPAEVTPGDSLELTAVVAGPDGPVDDVEPRWAFCTAPLPPGSPGTVSTACVSDPSALASIGEGMAVAATMPSDACARFGPDTPPGGFRPRDPDLTGGYQQPVRIDVEDDDAEVTAFGMPRVLCNLDSAPFAVAREYRERYQPNRNPSFELIAWRDGARATLDDIAAGETVVLEASWSPSEAEAYVSLDLESLVLVDRREALQVAWFATAGEFEVDSTGVAEGDDRARSSNTFTAPEEPGELAIWVVVRDSRGGVAARALELAVE